MLRIYFSILLTFCYLCVSAQTPLGNDWINTNQSYYKIKVSQKGLYRLTYSTLSQQIPTIGSINPKNFQLFKNGKEVSIYVQGESDNSFDNADYIEFYGEPNDGTLDKELYPVANTHPHNHYSLFTDTAAYFLTVSGTIGKRIQTFQASKAGLTPENYVIQESLGIYPETFYQGRYIIAHMSLSDYQEGEGFMGATYGLGTQQTRVLSTPNLYSGSGSPTIKFETYVAGRSDAQSTNPQGNNHHLRISIGNGASTFIKKDTLFRAYAVARTSFLIAANELGQNTQIIYESVNDLGAQTDYQAVAYAKITYPRTLDLQGAANLNFSLSGSVLNRFLSFANNNKTEPLIWDITSNQRIVAEMNGTNAEFVVSAANIDNRNFFLCDGAAFISPSISKVEMVNFALNTFDKNFIIITNKKLLSSAQNYASYRNQGSYKSFLITTEQLYDQFFYGIHHPLAVRNFAKYLLQNASTKPEYLLLLGKGLENQLIRGVGGINDDLVPTYGSPPSDDLLTARINTTSLAPAIATGRIGAKTNEEVEIYLEKLKRYELYENAIWRKKFIHITGGSNLSENLSWAAYQANMFNMAKNDPFGADTVNFHKNVTLPISAGRKQQIISEINKGASLLSFLGHGSHQHTEIDFGIPEELSNSDRLLTYLVNGCTTGNTFITSPSLGEKHIFYPQKGAIGWIGTSSEGVASYLSHFSSIFYQKVFNSNYGVSIASALKLTKEQYQNPNDIINVMHTTQYTFQGDPALKFYTPEKPDFEITPNDLYVTPADVTAISTSFSVGVLVKNIAKAVNAPLRVSLQRTLPNNSVITYPTQIFPKPVYHTDTLLFEINNNDVSSAGINKFTVTLDPSGEHDEISKTNNIATFEHNILANGVNLIFPKTYALVNDRNVELLVQSSNLLIGSANYIFEIDTVSTFDSSWKKNSGIISAGFMPKWNPGLLDKNNLTYYWRAKLDLPVEKGGNWQSGNFTYVNNNEIGWNQSHIDQLKNGDLTNIEYNRNNKEFEFTKSGFYTVIQTRGDDAPTGDERTFRSNPGGRLGYHSWEFEGISIFALKPSTFDPFSYPSDYNVVNQEADGSPPYLSGHYIFNTNNPIHLDSLVAFINQIPTGYHVIGFNGRNANFSALPETIKSTFIKIGVSKIGSIGLGEPYMFWGTKDAAAGTAIEKTADYDSPAPARNQQIRFDNTYPFPFDRGTYTSKPAGPASKWINASYEVNKETSDQVTFDLLGHTKNGAVQVLQTNLPSNNIDLSSFDAKQYPKMSIRINIVDAISRTVPQISKLRFTYEDIPEASINPDIKNTFHAKDIQEGDSVRWNIGYQNLSKYPSDSVHVYYTLTKPDRTTIRLKAGKIEELPPGANTTFEIKIPSLGLVSTNILKLDFIPINNNDSYTFNNYIQQNFNVTRDNKEPIVDVAFDGKHIMNGEIVSPQPNIVINLSDENSFILLKDTTVMNILLKSETGGYKRIAYSSGMLEFTPANSANNNKASVSYKPIKLADGIYTLMVEAKDASGNINSANNYTVDFEVINESAITHFYPYPNPFTTAMKFVFTLTGDKIPDKIKVQIMTVTGKIVREVFKEELGNIRIGNNISDFTWDGTDMYGDRLANGVYFYKVIVENNDKSEIKHRRTVTDNYFKQNTGKIYLMK